MLPIYKKIKKVTIYFAITICSFVVIPIFSNLAYADLADDLRDKINSTANQIQKLEEEIKIYEKSLNKTTEQAKSLKNELDALNLSKKKLETELKLTNKNLDKTTTIIVSLADQIKETENNINFKRAVIASLLNDMRATESISAVENFLSSSSITEVSQYIEQTERINASIKKDIEELNSLDIKLGGQKKDQETKKTELKKLQSALTGQQKAVADNAKIKDKLLVDTKNQESEYKKILDEKVKQREEFEKDLFKFESELKIAIDPKKLPGAKSGVISWPLEKITLTQQFGKTSSSGRLYASGTHNGVDFRATDGTKVMAVLSGTVTATGNTDLKKSCYSYGKWILIKHPNGLSSLYGHLSSISVSPGDTVVTGDIVGYSGRTGYVTGPHLHLTLLATEGVRVMPIPTATACNGVTIPIGTPQAFLDPLLYLPGL
jgi:murein DD-endopeptidase MepM/ murein hydrolase activator NlpD